MKRLTQLIKNLLLISLSLFSIFIISGSETNDNSSKQIKFSTGQYNYWCAYKSPAKLTKVYNNSPGEGELRIVTYYSPSGNKFYDQSMNHTTSLIDCSSNFNCCITAKSPLNNAYTLTAYYIQYGNFVSCSTTYPNLCHTWINQDRDSVKPSGYDPGCSNWEILIDDYLGHKTCSF